MDELIKQLLNGEIFWHETTTTTGPPHVIGSAFVPYPNASTRTELGFESAASGCNNGANPGNMNKKMIGFLRKSWPTMMTQTEDNEKERCFRHMMNERMRREKQKKSYFALHSMLPHGTKNDKNSIVQTATKRVQELKWLKKDMEKKNYQLKANLAANNNEGLTKIRVKIDNPTSTGIDSMLKVLNCLKELDSKPRMIQSEFTNQQFLALMDFETEMGAAKVEKVINITLQEIERKVQAQGR